MKKIVISNRKGGSAKTTTAVNLAAHLAKKHSVLLLDLDTQAHATMGVGVACNEQSGVHAIFNGKTLSESFTPSILENLTVSPAMELFDVYEYENLDGVLKQRIEDESIDEFFDYCIIDTPPTYDALLKNAIEVANVVIIPVVPHHLGIIGISQMLRALYRTAIKKSSSIDFIGILPVMYNPHIKEHQDALHKIEVSFGKEKLFTPIGMDIKLSTQFEHQEPLVLSVKRAKGMRDYSRFGDELVSRLQ